MRPIYIRLRPGLPAAAHAGRPGRAYQVVLLVTCVLVATPAHAYLDPATGTMLLSAVMGAVAAVGLAIKMFWYRAVGLLRGPRRFKGDRSSSEE